MIVIKKWCMWLTWASLYIIVHQFNMWLRLKQLIHGPQQLQFLDLMALEYCWRWLFLCESSRMSCNTRSTLMEMVCFRYSMIFAIDHIVYTWVIVRLQCRWDTYYNYFERVNTRDIDILYFILYKVVEL